MDPLEGILPVVSNFIGYLAAAKWYGMGHAIAPLVFIASTTFSIMYHACDWYSGLCILPYQTHHDLDFVFAQSVITTVAMSLIHWVSPSPQIAYPVGIPFLHTAFVLFFILVNSILVAVTDDGFLVQGAVFVGSFGIVIVYNLVYRCRFGRYPTYNLTAAVPAVVFTSTSVMLFQYQNAYPRHYWLIHSAWHALGYGGAWYWASVMPRYDPRLNVASKMPTTIGLPMPGAPNWWQQQGGYQCHKIIKIGLEKIQKEA